MKVMKFGGTSVGSVESILNLKHIVEAEAKPVIVVVSALGGITDRLLATSRMALNGDESWRQEFEAIKARHFDMIAKLFMPEDARREPLTQTITSFFRELESIYYGV
ncbi:MAG: amino acid kinase family protein, partial [Prevotella sp.]